MCKFNLDVLNSILTNLSNLKEQYQTKVNELTKVITVNPKHPNYSGIKNDRDCYQFLIYVINTLLNETYTTGPFYFEDYKQFLSNLSDISEKIEYQLF